VQIRLNLPAFSSILLIRGTLEVLCVIQNLCCTVQNFGLWQIWSCAVGNMTFAFIRKVVKFMCLHLLKTCQASSMFGRNVVQIVLAFITGISVREYQSLNDLDVV